MMVQESAGPGRFATSSTPTPSSCSSASPDVRGQDIDAAASAAWEAFDDGPVAAGHPSTARRVPAGPGRRDPGPVRSAGL